MKSGLVAAGLAALLAASPAWADPGRGVPEGLGAGIAALGLAVLLRGSVVPPPVVPPAPTLISPAPVIAAPSSVPAYR